MSTKAADGDYEIKLDDAGRLWTLDDLAVCDASGRHMTNHDIPWWMQDAIRNRLPPPPPPVDRPS